MPGGSPRTERLTGQEAAGSGGEKSGSNGDKRKPNPVDEALKAIDAGLDSPGRSASNYAMLPAGGMMLHMTNTKKRVHVMDTVRGMLDWAVDNRGGIDALRPALQPATDPLVQKTE